MFTHPTHVGHCLACFRIVRPVQSIFRQVYDMTHAPLPIILGPYPYISLIPICKPPTLIRGSCHYASPLLLYKRHTPSHAGTHIPILAPCPYTSHPPLVLASLPLYNSLPTYKPSRAHTSPLILYKPTASILLSYPYASLIPLTACFEPNAMWMARPERRVVNICVGKGWGGHRL